ncbi:C40 family peptidase [Mucisphaera sp.]|uniref:C40 family peptidase n=1 Tax=Mucisphaera sp. TaxID=2913024 RepID=UPI003D14FB1A
MSRYRYRTAFFLCLWTLTMTTPLHASNPPTPEPDVDEVNVQAGEIRRGLVVGSTDGKSREQRVFEDAISHVEPSMQGDPARLDVYIHHFKTRFVGDPRLFHFDVQATYDEPTGIVLLEGHVEYHEHRTAVHKMLGYMGFDQIDNEIQLVPDPALGDHKFAIVHAEHTFIYSKPEGPRETVTQTVFADPIFVLAPADNDHLLVHGPDGYLGYVAAADVTPVKADRFNAWRGRDQAVLTRDHQHHDLKIRLGASLPIAHQSADKVTVELPDGSHAELPLDAIDIHPNEPDPRSEAAIAAGMELLGVPYVWGGIASDGLDCSGFVQTVHRAQGVLLPRDADMQGTVGSLSATRWHRETMRRGDLMLFLGSRGRINHVGIYLGSGQYIESASGGVQITSIDPNDDNYNERRANTFCFAKRLFR